MSTQLIEGDSAPRTIEEIGTSILGVRSGYVPGFGYGVVPPRYRARVTTINSANDTNRVEIEELRTRQKMSLTS